MLPALLLVLTLPACGDGAADGGTSPLEEGARSRPAPPTAEALVGPAMIAPAGPSGESAGEGEGEGPEPTSRTDYSAPAEFGVVLPDGVRVGEIVRAWAPVWYHDVALRGPDGLGPKMDWYMAVDFDGDLRHDDNWEDLVTHEIRAALYYAFVATETHWFLTFSQYHARDWEQLCTGLATECHEGDMENVRLVLVAGAGEDGLGEPLVALSDAHGSMHTWSTPPGPSEFGPAVDWETDAGGWAASSSSTARRMRVFTEAKGHGPIPCRAIEAAPFGGWWGFGPGKPACVGAPYEDRFPGGDGLVFRPSAFTATPYWPGALEADEAHDYALLAYGEELWPHRFDLGHGRLLDPAETMTWVGGRDDPAFRFDEPIGVRFDPDQFPVEGYGRLGWSEHLEGSSPGDVFFDPAHALAAHLPALAQRPEGWSMTYVYNPYVPAAAPPP